MATLWRTVSTPSTCALEVVVGVTIAVIAVFSSFLGIPNTLTIAAENPLEQDLTSERKLCEKKRQFYRKSCGHDTRA
jgi:hypothetical protein